MSNKNPLRSRAARRRFRAPAAVVFAAASLLMAACGSSGSTQTAESGPAVSVDEAAWSEIVEAAKAEGSLVVYSSLSDVESSFAQFEELYPEIDVTIERAPTGDLITRLDQELEVNAQGADLTMHSQSAWFEERYGQNYFAQLKLSPEQTAAGWEDMVDGVSYAHVFTNAFIFGYNTSTGRPIETMRDVLGTVGGAAIGVPDAAITPAQTFLYHTWNEAYGDDFLANICASNKTVYGSNVPLGQSLAAGEISYGVGLAPSTLLSLKAEGAPVDYVIPAEANTGVGYDAAVLANAAHPNAAQVFADWLMSERGAEMFTENHGPASTPIAVEGSIPWGELPTPADGDWSVEDHEDFIENVWTPACG